MPDIYEIEWWIKSTIKMHDIEKMMYYDEMKDNLGEPW